MREREQERETASLSAGWTDSLIHAGDPHAIDKYFKYTGGGDSVPSDLFRGRIGKQTLHRRSFSLAIIETYCLNGAFNVLLWILYFSFVFLSLNLACGACGGMCGACGN